MTVEHRRMLRTPARLDEIARLGLDLEADRPYLQSIVDEVATRLDTPFVLIDALLDHTQVFLAGHGPSPQWAIEAGGSPLEWSMCQPLIAEMHPRQMPDLTEDPIFKDNPLVRLDGLRSYVGAPLVSTSGHLLGGLCGLDLRPRVYVPEELAYLQEMADEAVRRLEEFGEG